ncbi:hypothetical protein JTB14_034814 [Gonioctena quinquepunctata]|nr:hypothetical protein JTB14_034814 [Gonioctena quinquepunctata]
MPHIPRKYIRKRPKPTYTQEHLAKAVNDILNRNRTYKEVEDTYGIPKSVVFHRIKGRKVPIDKMGAGHPLNLLCQVETDLENCLKEKARMGYPCSEDEIKTQFKEGIPVNNNGLSNKPSFVFNCDESGFSSDPKRLKAIGEKGKPLSRISGGSGRESTTVLATVSADGYCLPPLIVFKGVAVQARMTSDKAYPGTMYTCSSNGWMEEPQLFEWFSGILHSPCEDY